MKLCMIGCGAFARQFHGPTQMRCARLDASLELTACCDIERDRARDYCAAFGFARHYTDLLEMLSLERPDAVVLAVPPQHTCSAASMVLARGFPLLLEKPPGVSRTELVQLIEAATKGQARAQVGFNRRYMPVMRRARKILDEAFALTPVMRIDYELLRYNRWDPDFSTTAVHAIDAVCFLAGSPFRTAQIVGQPVWQGDREATAVTVEAECVSGTRVRVEIQPVAGCNKEAAKIHAVGQSLVVGIPYPGERREHGTLEHWRGDELVTSFSDGSDEAAESMGIVDETRAFLAAVQSGTGFTPGLRDCHQQIELMEALRLHHTGPIAFQTP